MRSLHFTVHGVIAGQGNHRTNQYGATYETTKNHKPWREAVKGAAEDAIKAAGWDLAKGPIAVLTVWQYPRPPSHYGTGRNAEVLKPSSPAWPTTKTDLDKLCRATFDAMTDAGVYRDDKLIVMADLTKVWTEGLGGCFIRVTDLTPDEPGGLL